MNILLDTHILLWWLADDPKLSSGHRSIIANPDNLCYVSSVSIWEISIKSSIGKLTIEDNYIDELVAEGFLELPVTWRHCDRVRQLPDIHQDPFDRLLIAQAGIEQLSLLSVDEQIKKYEIPVI